MNPSLLLPRLRAVLLLVLAACVFPAAAQQTTRQVSLPNQDYTESTVDLAVKVLGGVVEIRRTWAWGRWYLNNKWADLQLQPDALGGIKSISRAGRVYSRQGAHGGAYSFDERNHIHATESGWQWYDPFGNSIDYDSEGRTLGWSNPASVRVSRCWRPGECGSKYGVMRYRDGRPRTVWPARMWRWMCQT